MNKAHLKLTTEVCANNSSKPKDIIFGEGLRFEEMNNIFIAMCNKTLGRLGSSVTSSYLYIKQ